MVTTFVLYPDFLLFIIIIFYLFLFSSSTDTYKHQSDMTLQPFSDKRLNFFKFSSLVLNEFPEALRQTFKTMWDNIHGGRPGFQPWDDSTAVRSLFATTEGGKTKVPIHQPYSDWDCTSLFQATIFARSFALPGITGSPTTLSDLYVKPRAIPHGSFHACVLSPGGNNAETFALAIDQLRLLRNFLCHFTSSEMDKATFDQSVNYAKDAFQALGVSTATIDAVGSLTESDFPTNEVHKLEMRIRDESRAYIMFLEEVSADIHELKASLHSIRRANEEDMEHIAMILEKKIQALTVAQDQLDAKNREHYSPILLGVSSDIDDVKKKLKEDTASKEDITRLEKKIEELKEGQEECHAQSKNQGNTRLLFSLRETSE